MISIAGSSADMPISLLPRLLIAALIFPVNAYLAEKIYLTVNVKKPLALTSDKFLSWTLDPTVALTGDALTKDPEKSVNMAKALSPAYVRIGGPRSNSYTFVKPHHSQNEQDPAFMITETSWINVHRWAENAGLEILASIAPQHIEIEGRHSVWDSRNALDLISFCDHMGFNASWQLGYECQTRCDVDGTDMGNAVVRLRSLLDAFPRYTSSVITGPDVVAYGTRQQQQYLQDYFNVAASALSAITWHPNFAGITLDAKGVSMHHDNLAIDRVGLYKLLGRSMRKKPLWLAESKPEVSKDQFLGALVWTRRLGNAARLGVQVIMRQPNLTNLIQPTPDYWVSVLHKTLVGREVLDARITNGNRSHVHFYCQCTRPSSEYEKGSLTIFGINLTPAQILVNFEGLKIKTIHKYILMPGFDAENRLFSEAVLLNDEPLNLIDDRELPEIKPAVSSNDKEIVLELPSGGIGFWVLPGLKIKFCGGLEENNMENKLVKKLSKRLEESVSDQDVINDESGKESRSDENLSTEKRGYSSRSNKNKRRIIHRCSKDEKKPERHYGRIEASMDLERLEDLEKLLRRSDNYEETETSSKRRTVYFGFDNVNHEESSNDEDLEEETSKEMRKKLVEYKKRLKKYEGRIKKIASRSHGQIIDRPESDKMFDSDKVMEAMTLISWVKNAIERLNISDDGDIDATTVNQHDVSSPNDAFLDELLESMKIKRAGIPMRIDDQLRAIYQTLADDRVRRRKNNETAEEIIRKQDGVESSDTTEVKLSRVSRETDGKSGVDSLVVGIEKSFRSSGRINEDTRERRNDRKNRRMDYRQDEQAVVFDSKTIDESEENNFYGFHKSEPIENFPKGDVYLLAEDFKEETASDCDDRVKDDDVARDTTETRKCFRRNETTTKIKPENVDDTWKTSENIRSSNVPIEFFENIKMAAVPLAHKNLKEYSELWEAEGIDEKIDDSSNTGIGEIMTIEKIVQQQNRDINEDGSANESAIEKPIRYREDLEAQKDKIAEYENNKSMENTKSRKKSSVRTSSTIDDASNSQRIQAAYRQNPLAKRKRAKDLTSSEYESSTHFGSMHFGTSTVSSAGENASGDYYDVPYKIIGESAKREKRSTDDLLESVLDREMIFQDDNDLKDCECRVTRSTSTLKTRDDDKDEKRRNERPKKTKRRRRLEEMLERRRYRKRKVSTASKCVVSPDKSYKHTMRTKRDAESSYEEITGLMTEEPIFIDDDNSKMEPPIIVQMGSEELEVSTSNNEFGSEEYENSEYNNFRTDSTEDLSSLQREKQNDRATKNLTFEEIMSNVSVGPEVAGTNKVISGEKEESRNYRALVDKRKVTESPIRSADSVETLNLKDSSKSTKISVETTEVPKAEENDETNLFDSEPDAKTLSSQNNITIGESATINALAKNEHSSTVIPDKSVEESTEKIQRSNEDGMKILKINHEHDNPKVPIPQSWTMMIAMTTEMPKISFDNENIETSGTMMNDTLSMKKTSPRTKIATKTIELVKLREARMPALLSALWKLRRYNTEKQTNKSKQTEQLAKILEKIRQLVNDYHCELLSELEEEVSKESENIRTPETIDMIISEEELRDLVDDEKFEYPKSNRSINYKATEDTNGLKDAKVFRKKYIPKMIDIVKPIRVARERKVKPRKKTVGATADPNLLAYAIRVYTSNSEVLKRRLEKVLMDREIKSFAVRPYDSVVESLKDPQIYEQQMSSQDQDFDKEAGVKIEYSFEMDEALMDSSPDNNNNPPVIKTHDYDGEDSSDLPRSHYKRTADSNEERVQSSKIIKDSRRTVRKATSNDQICLKKNSEETSSEASDELSKLVKAEDHYTAIPIDGTRLGDIVRHASKKRNLKNLDYELGPKYDSPGYARLALDSGKFVQDKKITKNDETDQRSSRAFDSGQTLEKFASKSTEKKTAGASIKNEPWIIRPMRGNSQKIHLAMNNYADSDEALNYNDYELFMLIPVNKNQKERRHRRHVGNDIRKEQGNSVKNLITIEMIPKNNAIMTVEKERNKDATIDDDIPITEISATLSGISNVKKDANNLTLESSTLPIVGRSKILKKNEENTLNGYVIKEIVGAVPKIVSNDRDKSVNDEGFPDILEEAIQKLEVTVTTGLGKARRISESFEQLIDEFDNRFDQKEQKLEIENNKSERDAENNFLISSDIFDSAFTNVRKFFDFLSGLVHVFHSN